MIRVSLGISLVLVACRSNGDGNDDGGTTDIGSTGVGPSTSGSMTVDPTEAESSESQGSTADGTDTGTTPEMTDTVMDHGVTWTFAEPVLTGRFVTGDPWIVCPATVITIDPVPENGRNGSVLNMPPVDSQSGFDDRVAEGRFDETLRSYPPIDLVVGDRLLSSISVETTLQVENWLREGSGEYSDSPVRSVSVLTCLGEPAPADAFRPSYGDYSLELRRLSELDRTRLAALAPPSAVDQALLDDFAARMPRPWIDTLFFGFDAQVEYMPVYGREVGRATSIASMLVMLELPEEQRAAQERVLIGLVQRGVDLWGLVRAGHPGWSAFGGHGSGRKFPIVFAGILFGDAEMSSPSVAYPATAFGEDMHTAFVGDLAPPADQPVWWNEADVVYTGHQGVLADGTPVSADPAWGPYEHLPPAMWLSDIGESYRRCCTSIAWVGQALALRLLDAQGLWAHDAFFAYVDRWMDPTGDAEYTAEILTQSGYDFTAAWAAHGLAWDPVVEQMWAAYR